MYCRVMEETWLLIGTGQIRIVRGQAVVRHATFLLVWLASTTNLKIGVVHKENPAGRAITKLLGSPALDK